MSAPTFKVRMRRTCWLLDDVVEEGAVITVTLEMMKHLASLGAAYQVADEAPAPAPAAPVAPTAPAPAPVAPTEPVKAPAKATKPAKAK